jgi:glycogen operon protein
MRVPKGLNGNGGGWAYLEGTPTPLGVSVVEAERALNFALYSKHAESVTLLLFAEEDLVTPARSVELDPRSHKSGRVWHCRISEDELSGIRYYAYRIGGPKPQGRFEWHWFDPEKILLDPYARAIFFPPTFERGAAAHPGPNDGRAALGLIRAGGLEFDWEGDSAPRHDADLVVYEMHVRGFTRHPSSGVEPERRGTFLGLLDKIPYLQDLGVTAIELMPVFQWDPLEGNYWGYMPLSFFAPHSGFATRPGAQHEEFRTLIRALHRAGIEVILDVVFNHTGEGGADGPIYCYKGIDNSTYYLMTGDPGHPFADFSGTGNTLHTANAYVRKLILDSLRYWVTEMHVDGFRFDLASVFTRDEQGTIEMYRPGIFADISSDPLLSSVRLIAEPWDNSGGYHLGRSFPGLTWAQWNGAFRDDLRRFVRGEAGLVPVLMTRLYGSDDLFPDDRMHAFHPYQSVNYVTCHDGFTLYDLVSYDRKRNWANGHANEDGVEQNYSWNHGWEGDVDVPAEVRALRARQVRNYCCLLLLANGTPMLRAGDELLQTQCGNNNPYNQDNETSWLDWSGLDEHAEIHRFFRGMIAFRKSHPSLCRSRFWRDDVHWHGTEAVPDLSPESHTLAFLLEGSSQGDDDLYVMINGSEEDRSFAIQVEDVREWRRIVDTALSSPNDIVDPGGEVPLSGPGYGVRARSVVVLCRWRRPSAVDADGRRMRLR